MNFGGNYNVINWRFVLALILTAAMAIPAAAQVQYASIAGLVSDPTGAVIPDAEVTITNTDTNLTLTVTTGPAGRYTVDQLPIGGRYKVEVSADGFKTAAVTKISLNAGTIQRVDVALEVGARAEVITVEGAPPLVNTEDSRPYLTVANRQVQELPLNGRNVYDLVALAPGVMTVAGVTTEFGSAGQRGDSGGTVSNGLRPNFSGFLMNGSSNKGLSGGVVTLPNPDLVAEFQQLTLNMSAQYGNSAASINNLVTKSGTNDFHGSTYWFIRNDALDATEFFRNRSGAGTRKVRFNQFGATATGPIIRDKLFFTGSYQGERFKTQLPAQPLTQETSAWRNAITGAFPDSTAALLYGSFEPNASALPGTVQTLDQFIASGAGFSSSFADYMCPEVLDPSGLDQAAAANLATRFQNLFGVTQSDINELTANGCSSIPGAPVAGLVARDIPLFEESIQLLEQQTLDNLFDGDEWSTRVDWVSQKNRIFGEFYWQLSEDSVGPDNANQSGGRGGESFANPQELFAPNFNFSWVTTLAPTLLNELRAGYVRNRNDIGTALPGVPYVVFDDGSAGFGSYNGYPQLFRENIYNFSDMVSITKGTHNLKVGAEFRRNIENSEFNVARPSYYFFDQLFFAVDAPYEQVAGVDPGVLSGQPAELASNVRTWENWEMGFFVQDDWKVLPRLTLNLGLRYDLFTRHKEKFDRETTFLRGSGTGIVEQILNANVPAGSPGCDTPEQIAQAQLAGICGPGGFAAADRLGDGDNNNFGPRIGAAWDVFGTGKTVLRGGVGVSYEGTLYNPLSNSRWNLPFYSFNIADNFLIEDVSNTIYGPPAGQSPSFEGAATNVGQGSGAQAVGNLTGWDPNNANLAFLTGVVFPEGINDPYIFNYHVGIQHEVLPSTVLEVSWVGTRGYDLFRAQQVNRVPGVRLDNGESIDVQGRTLTNPGQLGSRRFLNPNYGRLRVWQNVTKSWYDSLQVSARKAMSHGIMFNASYTWSHSLDTGSTWHSGATTANGAAGGEGYSLDQTLPDLDRGNSIFDIRHRFVANYVWELPFGRDTTGAARHLLDGWQLNGIVSLQSGAHFSAFCNQSASRGCDWNLDGEPNDRPDVGAGGNDFNPTTDQWANGWFGNGGCAFDVSGLCPDGSTPFFTAPCRGCNGNLGRNTFEGPGIAAFDLSVFKNIEITETVRFQFRFEAFNLFNRTNFMLPDFFTGNANEIRSASFGQSQGTLNPRNIQFGLKLLW
jgi:hypothetical protein